MTSRLGIDVRFGPVEDRLGTVSSSGVLWQAGPDRFLLAVPGVGRYLVEDGRTITVDPDASATSAAVDRFLNGTPMAAVHLQRGIPVLHAAVVARADSRGGAILLAGDSATGKSALAATLWARGYRVLADDLAPIGIGAGVPFVTPFRGELIVWPDVIDRLCEERQSTTAGRLWQRPFGPAGLRRRIDVSDRFAAQRCDVQEIWWLGQHNSNDIEIRDIRGVGRFSAIAAMAANSRIASALIDGKRYLSSVGSLAASGVPIRKLIRPRGRWCAEELADLVEDSVAR